MIEFRTSIFKGINDGEALPEAPHKIHVLTMGLKSEIDEIKNAWSQASPREKVRLAVKYYIFISAAASLSEEIVKWKGVFRNALTFYHHLRDFVRELLFYLIKLDLAPVIIDYLVIYTLLISSFLRALFVERKNNLKANPILNRELGMQLFLGIVYIALISLMERVPNIYALALASI